MSREAREKKLRKVWRYYLTAGHRWTRQDVAKKVGVRVEDVQRLIDEAGPTKIRVASRGGKGHC
jgi:DNA-binding transcriptional regulator LsrR (DeoR family)